MLMVLGLFGEMADGFGDNIQQCGAVFLNIFDDLFAHSWFPGISDVLLHALNGQFSIGFGFEKSADVIGHFD